MAQLGGTSIYLAPGQTQLDRGEPISDTARVLSRYVDAVVIRTFAQKTVEDLARHASIPVINGLTDTHHPCQVLSDLMTIKERFGAVEGLKVAWVGDGNNMANSWITAALHMDFGLYLACPQDTPRTPACSMTRKNRGGPFIWAMTPNGPWRRPTSSTPTSGPPWARKRKPRPGRKFSSRTRSTRN
jgi:ornithine carbamoyltransferase